MHGNRRWCDAHVVGIIVPHQSPRIDFPRSDMFVNTHRSGNPRPWRPAARQMSKRSQRIVSHPLDFGIPTGFHCVLRPSSIGGYVSDVLNAGGGFARDDVGGPEFFG